MAQDLAKIFSDALELIIFTGAHNRVASLYGLTEFRVASDVASDGNYLGEADFRYDDDCRIHLLLECLVRVRLGKVARS